MTTATAPTWTYVGVVIRPDGEDVIGPYPTQGQAWRGLLADYRARDDAQEQQHGRRYSHREVIGTTYEELCIQEGIASDPEAYINPRSGKREVFAPGLVSGDPQKWTWTVRPVRQDAPLP